MTDKNDFEYISDILDSMRAQNAISAGNTDKVLTSINNQLQSLVNEDNNDLIKVFMVELKKNLDERYNFVSLKFSEIENSFNEILERTKNQLQASEIKELFEIIASNLNTFSAGFSSQKELISNLDLKIEELQKDESQKKEVLKNISTLKVELEKINNGFESVVLHMSTNFKEVAKTLDTLDTSEELSGLKKDIENIFLSTNAVISTMQVIDHKNRELEEIIKTFVTKEDFNVEREQVAKLIAQNVQMAEYINTLPTQNNFKDLTEKFDTSIGVINALKNMLTETGKQNQKMLTAQLDNLETKILNISTEEEFIGFRKELSEFAQEVIQSTNLMRTDIADTNADLKDLCKFLSEMDIKNTFANFEGLTKESEEVVTASIAELSQNVSKEIEKNRKITKSDVDKGIAEVNETINEAKQEIAENSKVNLASILEHIQSVVNNIFSVKNALHIDNLESVEAIDAKFQDLKEEITTSNNFIAQTSHNNLENITSNFDKISQEISDTTDGLSSKITNNFKNFTVSLSEITPKIEEIKGELSRSSQENFANISSIVEDFSREIANVKISMEETSAQNFEGLKGGIDVLTEKFSVLKEALTKDTEINTIELRSSMETLGTKMSLMKAALTQELKEEVSEVKVSVEELSESFEHLKDTLVHDAQANVSELKTLVEDLTQVTASVKASLEQSSSIGFAGLKTNIGELSQELSSFSENFDFKSQANLSKILSVFDDLAKDFENQKDSLSDSVKVNFETVFAYIQDLNKRIEETQTDFSEDLKANLAEMQTTVLELPETIKQNQEVFINENRINFAGLQSTVTTLPDTIKENQEAFINENRLNFAELRSTITTLPEAIKENQATFVNESRFLLEENSKTITETGEKLQGLIKGLATKENPLKNELLQAFSELKSDLEMIKEELAGSNQSIGENITEEIQINVQNLESLISQYSDKYDATMIDLQNRLEDKLELIDQTAQNNNFKLSDAIKETSGIKAEIQNLMENVLALKDDSAFVDLSEELSNKFEGLLLNIRQVEEASLTKNKEALHNALNALEERFETVCEDLKQYQNIAKVEAKGAVEELSEKIEDLKIQTNIISTDIINVLSAKEDEILMLLSPLKEAVEKISQTDFEEPILEIKSKIDSSLSLISSTIRENIEHENTELGQKFSQDFEKLSDKFGEILSKSSMHAIEINNLKEILDEISKQIERNSMVLVDRLDNNEFLTEQFINVKEIILDTKTQSAQILNETSEALLEKFDDFENKIFESQTGFKKELSQNFSRFGQDLELTETKILNAQNGAQENISDKFIQIKEEMELLGNKLSEAQNESQNEVFDKFVQIKEEIETLGNKISETQNGEQEAVSDKFTHIKESLELFENKMLEIQGGTKEELSDKITKLQEELESSILTELQENIGVIKQVLTSVSEKDDDEVPEKIKELDIALKSASEKLDKVLLNSEKDLKESAKTLLSEVKTSFYEKVDDSIDDLKSFIELIENQRNISEDVDNLRADVFDKFSETAYNIDENKKDLVSEIDNLKTEIFDKFSEADANFVESDKNLYNEIDSFKEEIFDRFSQINAEFEQSISSISVKEDLDGLKNELETSINNLTESFYEKISSVIEEKTSNSDILNKSEEIARRIEDLKNSVVDDITHKLAEFEVQIEKQSKDFAELLEATKGSLAEIKENFVDLSLNSTMEISNLLVNVQEKVETIENKFGAFNLDEEFKGIENKIDSLNLDEKFTNIESKFEQYNVSEKIDEIKTTVENIDLSSVVKSIEDNFAKKDSQQEIKQEFEVINQKLDLFAMDSNSDIKGNVEEIKQIVESQNNLIKQLNKTSSNEVAGSASNELKKIVEKFEEKLNLLALEDVSDTDKSAGIKKELSSFKEELFENLVEFFNQISFVVEAEEIKDFVEEKTEEIKEHLKSIKDIKVVEKVVERPEEEIDGYSYTLQDVESDIAKVRMVLNDIVKSSPVEAQKASPTGDFQQLNENIMSISSRTNKLLLNSDESYATLKNNLDNLKDIVYQFEEKVKNIDNKEPIIRIEKKLEDMNKLMVSSVQSDKIFNQTFMYLAEWIDKADEKMTNIETKVSEVEDIKMSMLKSYDLEVILDKFVKKFEKQEEKIKALETKIEKLNKGKGKAAPEAETDVKSIVQEVLAKIELSEKPDEKLAKKMDGIDRRLTTLGKNIEKITSYVE